MKRGNYLDSKEHKEWRLKIIERDKCCVICGETKSLSAHHLIPKEVISLRSDVDNGLALCFKHHSRYGWGISPHSHGSFLFFMWLMKNRPEQFNKLADMWKNV